ncbi:unnamed protein product [Acanthoscelides obtectus]|uniref:BED-type domain-containing protein n=1 Tax=Acanthoscelides obtectus TaxID=200917 RepID=A0A9P0PNI1_ACAOB|nr:unnamed protein product [Acanthoscelides obtectus]CAK1621823.1 hypothetical protein AOBTE_LOCUS1151 [Acanthoscelides obtectus]
MESSASGSGESQTQKRSVIWMHFTNISEANAKSNLCKNIYSHKNGNISNLRKHLKTKYPTLSLEGERAKRRVEDENMPRCKRNLVLGDGRANLGYPKYCTQNHVKYGDEGNQDFMLSLRATMSVFAHVQAVKFTDFPVELMIFSGGGTKGFEKIKADSKNCERGGLLFK